MSIKSRLKDLIPIPSFYGRRIHLIFEPFFNSLIPSIDVGIETEMPTDKNDRSFVSFLTKILFFGGRRDATRLTPTRREYVVC